MEHKGTEELFSERLILRRFRPEDAEAAFRNWTGDPEVTEFLSWPAHKDVDVTKMVLADWIRQYEQPSFYQWAIVLKTLGEPIGSISVVRFDDKAGCLHIGYCIGKQWWHQGYTSEALATVLPFFFDKVKANRVESCHDVLNIHSGDVMKKCGMQYEGTMRKSHWTNRGIVDMCLYAILADDVR